jgi:hypothetical protein
LAVSIGLHELLDRDLAIAEGGERIQLRVLDQPREQPIAKGELLLVGGAAGARDAPQGGTGGTPYTAVNETPNDDDTSYLKTGTVNALTTLPMDDLPILPPIISVQAVRA